ncbi:uncharacterized protein LOC135972605 [Chrysemys picta bellii]|uniref:uncharacterized protein LOC135972605 n=1 Tax=Chrysemys picta bellii TaxID=8478 RepID=UPI0032B307F6
MQLIRKAAGLWLSIRSTVGLPGLVLCLLQFLRFHPVLLLLPVIPLCLHPLCNLFVDVHFSTSVLQLCLNSVFSHRPRRSNTSCLFQERARLERVTILRQMLRNRARRLRQRGEDIKSERGTDLSQSTGPCAVDIMVAMGHVDAMERLFWARETSTDWWDRIVLQVWDESQWLRNFRMRKGTFLELCELLSPALKHKDTRMRAALTVQKRVAIALWKLATPDNYRSVANHFGVGKSTVGVAVMQVANAIIELLLSKVVTLGNVQVIIDGFAAMGFPNCGGAIDGTHIPILGPATRPASTLAERATFQWCCKHWWTIGDVLPTSTSDGRARFMMLAFSGTLVCLDCCRKVFTSRTTK